MINKEELFREINSFIDLVLTECEEEFEQINKVSCDAIRQDAMKLRKKLNEINILFIKV